MMDPLWYVILACAMIVFFFMEVMAYSALAKRVKKLEELVKK